MIDFAAWMSEVRRLVTVQATLDNDHHIKGEISITHRIVQYVGNKSPDNPRWIAACTLCHETADTAEQACEGLLEKLRDMIRERADKQAAEAKKLRAALGEEAPVVRLKRL